MRRAEMFVIGDITRNPSTRVEARNASADGNAIPAPCGALPHASLTYREARRREGETKTKQLLESKRA
jgi:hypothetical protein